MKIIQLLGSNAVLVIKKNGKELVALGKGIGFGKKVGQLVDTHKIERKFTLEDSKEKDKFFTLLESVKIEDLTFIQSLIAYIQYNHTSKLKDSIHFALTDHIVFAVERYKQGNMLNNFLLPEIRRFYLKEFTISAQILEMINSHYNVCLPEDEAGFIAIHIVNAQFGESNSGHTMLTLKILDDILIMLKKHENFIVEEGSIDYDRMLIHLKYFVHRFNFDKQWSDDEDFFIKSKIKSTIGYDLATAIAKHLEVAYSKPVTIEEILYLSIHLNRMAK